MKNNIFKRILSFDISIILIFLFMLVFGIVCLFRIKVSLLPRHSEPVLTIITEYYGMEPDIIEEIITRPIESLLKSVKGIKNFYSFSYRGRSKIIVYLDPEEDIDRKALLIKDKIYHISNKFPKEFHEPAIYRYNTEDKPVMIISLSSNTYPIDELYNLVNLKLKPELLAVDGVANVEIAGSKKQEYFIEKNYEGLARWGKNYETIFKEIVKNNVSSPLGSIKNGNNLINITYPNTYNNLLSLNYNIYSFFDRTVYGNDLFLIKKLPRDNERISIIDNKPALTLYIFKKDFSSILEIENHVKQVFNAYKKDISKKYIFNQAENFRNLLKQLKIALIISVICVFTVVFLFYKDLFLSFLVISTIPFCLGATFVFLKLGSKSLNLMTLSGIIVGIGISVDNTLIMVEVIKSNIKYQTLDNTLVISMDSANRPILASTLTTVIVFLPLFYINSSTISLYSDFALTVAVMLFWSYLTSILFFPSFIKRFYGDRITGLKGSNFFNNRKLDNIKNHILSLPVTIVKRVLDHSNLIICGFFVVIGAFIFLFIKLEYENIHPLKEKTEELYFEFEPIYSMPYMKKKMEAIGDEILAMMLPVTLVSRLDGTKATFLMKFKNECKTYKEDIKRVKSYFLKKKRKDGFFYFQSHSETGIKSVTLYLFGDNIKRLNHSADLVSEGISRFGAVKQVLKGYKEGKPQVLLNLDNEKMYYYNINSLDVIRFLRYIFYCPVIMKYCENNNVIDVRGKIKIDQLKKDDISLIRIPNESGEYIRIKDFSTIDYSNSPGIITRKNGKRYISIDVGYENAKEKDLIKAITSYIKGVDFDKDSYYEFDEKIMENKKNRHLFGFALFLAGFMVYIILGLILKSFKYPFLIVLIVPSIFIGSFIFLWAFGYGRSVPAHIATIMLTGLSVNSIIVLLEEALRIQRIGVKKAILLSYRRKITLLAIMFLTTIFSLIPVFVVSTSTYFFKILTRVIFSGMISTLIISICVFPAFYLRFNKRNS